jgi:hypothetical protein
MRGSIPRVSVGIFLVILAVGEDARPPRKKDGTREGPVRIA